MTTKPWTTFALVMTAASAACVAQPRQWIEQQKIRAAFDYMHVDDRDHLARLAGGGFNTIVLSIAGLDVDKPDHISSLKKHARWCDELGLHVFVTNRLCGGAEEVRYLRPGGRCYVDGRGEALTRTPCPVDADFWRAVVIRRWQLIAELSRSHDIEATLLDPEMYGADVANFPGYCYCEPCLREFIGYKRLSADVPAAAERVGWLESHGLMDEYQTWKQQRAEAMARQTEQHVHAINPKLMLGVLMLDANNWYANAWARGFGTGAMPVIAFSENTYGTGATPYLDQTQQRFEQMGAHVLLCPGMWLQRFEVRDIAGHLFHMADSSAGYWVFTTYGLVLPAEEVATNDYSLRPPQEQYLDAFRQASAELDRKAAEGSGFTPKLEAVHRVPPPRVTLGEHGLLDPATTRLRPINPGAARASPADKPTLLRYGAVYYILGAAGQPITGRLGAVQTGQQLKSSVYALIAPDGEVLTEGVVPLGGGVDLNVTADQAGVYKLAIVAHANLFTVELAVPHYVVSTTDVVGVSVVQHANRMYFYVPADVDEFKIEVATPYVAEQATVTVWDADGREAGSAATFETLPAIVTLKPAPNQRARAWSLLIEPTYSANLIWDPRLPPYLAHSPDALLVPAEDE